MSSTTNDVEKSVSAENSNANMMTVEIPVISPVTVETTTITTATDTSAAPPPLPTTQPPTAVDTVDFKKSDINDQLQHAPPPTTVTTTVTITTKGN